jgi:broad specificity phosphatase PhoE
VTLLFVRHGRTATNAAGRLLGRADPPLDDVGRAQAAALAELIGPVDRVVSSPLRRARETAAALSRTLEVDERFIELDYGELDGAALADLPASMWAQWRSDPAFAPPGGESLAVLGTRVREACEELAPAARTARIAVVSHVSPVKAALGWALGVGDEVSWRTHVSPGSVTTVAVGARGPVLHGFNEVAGTTAAAPTA